jgi:hypothetical protein
MDGKIALIPDDLLPGMCGRCRTPPCHDSSIDAEQAETRDDQSHPAD